MKNLLLTSVILTAALQPTKADAEPISYNDIVVLEIRATDLGLKIKSDAEYQKNLKLRKVFRKKIIEFLPKITQSARFVLIDMWFPDLIDQKLDKQLASIFIENKNLTVAEGDYNWNEHTNAFFSKHILETGHIFIDYTSDFEFGFYMNICTHWPLFYEPLSKCPKAAIRRHIALIAAEGFLGYKLAHPDSGAYVWQRAQMVPFKRISLTDYKSNPEQINGKLVLFISRSTDDVDLHKWQGKYYITGSEILANVILGFARQFPRR